MRFEIITIFPGFFSGIFENGILRRALAEERVTVGVHDLRAFTHDRHRTVDDRPFGGGEGMVLKPEPLGEALASLGIAPKAERLAAQQAQDEPVSAQEERVSAQDEPVSEKGTGLSPYIDAANEPRALAPEGNFSVQPATRSRVILLSAQGRPFTQALARELAAEERVVLVCGRYEGVDERINQLYCDMELSIGDYVLSGGELAAAVVIDATMRLLPGVLGNEASGEFESFGVADAEIASPKTAFRARSTAPGACSTIRTTRAPPSLAACAFPRRCSTATIARFAAGAASSSCARPWPTGPICSRGRRSARRTASYWMRSAMNPPSNSTSSPASNSARSPAGRRTRNQN